MSPHGRSYAGRGDGPAGRRAILQNSGSEAAAANEEDLRRRSSNAGSAQDAMLDSARWRDPQVDAGEIPTL